MPPYLQLFSSELRRCFNGNIPNRLLVALSGGVDSMCLTYLLTEYRKKYNLRMDIHALTIDHGYRPGSSQEARMVGLQVSNWGVQHHIKKLSYDRELNSITNFEEVARTLRYQALRDMCTSLEVNSVLVAHTLDDQIETFLQRLQMNSTLYGLSGLRPRSPLPLKPAEPENTTRAFELYRPLLSFSKEQLREICDLNNVEWFEDSTNADPTVTKRNWLRYLINEYLPATESTSHLLSRGELIKSVEAVESMRIVFEQHIRNLDDYVKTNGSFRFDEKTATIEFSVEALFWSNLHDSVSGRWLYDLMYPLSSSDNYHWSYAKIERHAMPRIKNFLAEKEKKFSMTYLNVKIDVNKRENGAVKFRLSRQPVERERRNNGVDLNCLKRLSQWVLVNNLWWIRLSDALERRLTIKLYEPNQKKLVQKTFPDVKKISLEIPIILDSSNGEMVAIPTMGLSVPDVKTEWHIKRSNT